MKRLAYVIGLFIVIFLSLGLRATTVIVTVGNGGNFFSPAYFTIAPGDTVKWVWSSGFHNTSNFTRPTGALSWYSNITNTDTIFHYTPTVSGLYTYTCTHHSGMDGSFFVTGCSFPVKPVISSSSGPKCLGDTLLLQVVPQSGVSYQWIEGLSSIPFSNTPDLKVTNPGTYRCLVNGCGVDSVSGPFAVLFDTVATPDFTYTNTGFNYNFINGMVPGNYSFIWRFSDGSPDQTTVHATHSFATAGQYIVKLIVGDITTGCTDSLSKQIIVQSPLYAHDQNILPVVFCDGRKVNIDLRRTYNSLDIGVIDIRGKVVLSKTMHDINKFSFDTEDMCGMYFVRIKIDNEKLVNLKVLGCN